MKVRGEFGKEGSGKKKYYERKKGGKEGWIEEKSGRDVRRGERLARIRERRK